jgi:hypothetical protein
MRFLKYWLSFEWIYDYDQKRKRQNGHTRYFG